MFSTHPIPEESFRPPLTLVTGAAGSGKTEEAISRFLAAEGKALLVAASPPQADTIAGQIAARSGMTEAEARLAVLPFRNFVGEIYREQKEDGYRLIGRAFQRIALAEIVQQQIRRDDFLGRMLDAPGFVTALADRIREWRLACLTSDRLESSAKQAAPLLEDGSFVRKTEELARLFRAYEVFLKQHRLRDEEECLQLAIQRVQDGASLPNEARVLLVDGFYRFNRAQQELLAAAATRRAKSGELEIALTITLPYDARRPLLFAAPERTRQLLQIAFTVQETVLPSCRANRPATIDLLEARLFTSPVQEENLSSNKMNPINDGMNSFAVEPSAVCPADKKTLAAGILCEAHTAERPTAKEFIPSPTAALRNFASPPDAPDSLQIFDAPNPYVEAEMVAREFRRIHDAGGYAWNDFAVILRTQGDYAPILSAVFERYAIPLGVDGPEKLADNPLMKTVLHLLDIFCKGWQRDDVLAFLKSSYTEPDKLAADGLRRRARTAHIREGRENWLHLAEQLEETPLASVAAILKEIALCEDNLAWEKADPMQFAAGIYEAIQQFGLEERIETGETVRKERDKAALEDAKEVVAAVAQMAAISGRELIPFAEFCTELRAAWGSAMSLAMPTGDLVRVAEPYDSRERPLKFVAVMGLTERVFPRRIAEDPFLRDRERMALRQAAGVELESQRDRADDERLFFYLAVTAPAERLILSYPRSSDESDTLPSFYLDEVRAIFESDTAQGVPPPLLVSRTLADVAPQPDECVNAEDRLLAACANLFDPTEARAAEAERTQEEGAAQIARCLNNAESALSVRAVLASRRLPRLPRLADPLLRKHFADQKTVYSVSELETYHRCPFQYLLRHVLRLRTDEDNDPKAQGTLLHDVLRRYFRRRKKANRTDSPDAAAMRIELHALLQDTLKKKPMDATPHRTRMIQRTLADALDGFAERETRFAPQFQMKPAHFELAFGLDAGLNESEEDERDLPTSDEARAKIYDEASCPDALCLTAADGGVPVRICGSIDRVDFDITGQRALIFDYKLGKPPEYSEIANGSSLQMPLYLLAMERLFDKTPAAACYDSVRETGRRRFHRTEHVNVRNFGPMIPHESGETVKPLNREQFADITRQAEMAAIQVARSIATSRVEARPGDHCRFCNYADVCRTSTAYGHDGEPLA